MKVGGRLQRFKQTTEWRNNELNVGKGGGNIKHATIGPGRGRLRKIEGDRNGDHLHVTLKNGSTYMISKITVREKYESRGKTALQLCS